jgi:hypothetical protein
MSPAYFKPRQMLAALMLGGVCATASATNADDLNRVLDSLNGNAPANDSTAADQAPANTSVSNAAAGLKVFGTLDHAATPGDAVANSAAAMADRAPAHIPEPNPVAPLLTFGSATAPVRESPTANMFRSLTEHPSALDSKSLAADSFGNRPSTIANVPASAREDGAATDDASTIDLPRALDAATENALTTKIARGQADQAQARVMGARAAYYPKISVIAKTPDKIYDATPGYGRTYDEFAQVSSTIQYTVFDFGRRKNQVQSAKLAADASENAYQSEVELLTYNTSRAYLDVVRHAA